MRVLIIGCGYVGLPLGIELVRLGHEVFGLRRNTAAENELKSAGLKPIFADITQLDELKKLPCDFDWVVNCVAANGADYYEVYLRGTKNIVAWLENSPPKKFVYTSSTSVYAQNDGSLVNENSPAEPLAETSKILVATEKVLLAAFAEKKFPAVILRVAGIYGPQRGHLFQQFLKNEALLDGDGARFLNMIHRDDVMGCIISALKNGRAGEIYNAADDAPVSQLNLYKWLAERLEKKLPASETENLPARKRGVTNKRVSNEKLKSELKYEFQFPDFRRGYAQEISGFRPKI
jgi:nucleoside-diphosphate-sugar epimerase